MYGNFSSLCPSIAPIFIIVSFIEASLHRSASSLRATPVMHDAKFNSWSFPSDCSARNISTMSKLPGDSKPLHLQFEYYFSGDILILQSLGLYSMGNIFNRVEANFYFWETIPFIFGVGGLFFGLMSDFRSVFIETRKHSLYAIEVLAAALCCSLGIYKAFHLRWNEEISHNAITDEMVEHAKSMRRFRIWYGTVVAAIFTAYVLRPCLVYLRFKLSGTNDTFDYSQTAYPAEYPFTLSTPRSYFCCITLEAIGIYFLILYWTAADGLFGQLTTQLAIHFQILANRMRDIPTNEKEDLQHTKIVVERLKKTVQDYLKLFEYVTELERIYNPILFGTVLVNGLNLCTCLYSMQYRMSNNEWGLAGKNALLTTGITAQTMMFCVCAQRLNDEVAGVRQAAYNCSWTEFNSTIKNMILLIMIQTEPDYIYTAYGFIYLNIPQLTVIFTAAMRFFTLLRNMT
ncbi:odorant receptor 13a-like isoform X2 [Diachasmimorpha longicaudata]|uniref:odorant receptor 13a-like isoform X2 n=1 Tax=Diachasmimorpha longicaudata TaxID=58733 RepID=UPI0030B8FD02